MGRGRARSWARLWRAQWARRFRQTGSVATKPMGRERNSLLKDERDWLLARIAASPDLPLHEIRRELTARNGTISSPRMSTPQQKAGERAGFLLRR
jgi:transposase